MEDSLHITRDDIIAAAASKLASDPVLQQIIEREMNRRLDAVQLLTVKEVAVRLKVPIQSVYRLPLRSTKVGDRVRFRITDLEKFIESGKTDRRTRARVRAA